MCALSTGTLLYGTSNHENPLYLSLKTIQNAGHLIFLHVGDFGHQSLSLFTVLLKKKKMVKVVFFLTWLGSTLSFSSWRLHFWVFTFKLFLCCSTRSSSSSLVKCLRFSCSFCWSGSSDIRQNLGYSTFFLKAAQF